MARPQPNRHASRPGGWTACVTGKMCHSLVMRLDDECKCTCDSDSGLCKSTVKTRRRLLDLVALSVWPDSDYEATLRCSCLSKSCTEVLAFLSRPMAHLELQEEAAD